VKVIAHESGQMMSASKEQRFTEIYLARYADVLGYLLRRSAGHDARDAAAEVFTVVWRRIDEMPDGADPLAWLYGVAANVLANQRRGERRRRNLRSRMNGLAAAPVIVSEPHEGEGVAGEHASLVTALNTLSDVDREVLLLNAWEGLPASQIAARFEISLAAAEKRLSRAKARLARTLPPTEQSTGSTATSNLREGEAG
jgi:RNA polymerase sigma-70 factor (ECF subfamily)